MTDLTLPYFVSLPAEPNGRGVVLVHEGLGLTTQILRVAERLAGEGFTVVAPDFFFRTGGPRDEDWWTSIDSITPDDTRADLATAIGELRGLGATAFGVTGFCLGGRISYQAARWADDLDVGAVVSFYGKYVPDLGELHCPALLLFAGQDEYVTAEEITTVTERHPDDVHVYPDNGHAFMRDGDESYDPVTAADAWGRLLTFFGEHLRPA
jgi:carboxymethylenebutenolidase